MSGLGVGAQGAYVVTWNGIVHGARATFEEADEFVCTKISDLTARGVSWEHVHSDVWLITSWNLRITYCPFYPPW